MSEPCDWHWHTGKSADRCTELGVRIQVAHATDKEGPLLLCPGHHAAFQADLELARGQSGTLFEESPSAAEARADQAEAGGL